MNCATPCAPFRLTARGLNRLSCQIRRVKNSIGSSLAAAADCTTEQIVSRPGGSPGAEDCAFASGSLDCPSWASPGRAGSLVCVTMGFAHPSGDDCGIDSSARDAFGAPASHKAMMKMLPGASAWIDFSAPCLPICAWRLSAAVFRTQPPHPSHPAGHRNCPARNRASPA